MEDTTTFVILFVITLWFLILMSAAGIKPRRFVEKRICSYRAMRYFLVYHFYLIG